MMCTHRFRRLRILKGGVTQQIFVFLSALPKKMNNEEAKPKLFHSSSYFWYRMSGTPGHTCFVSSWPLKNKDSKITLNSTQRQIQ